MNILLFGLVYGVADSSQHKILDTILSRLELFSFVEAPSYFSFAKYRLNGTVWYRYQWNMGVLLKLSIRGSESLLVQITRGYRVTDRKLLRNVHISIVFPQKAYLLSADQYTRFLGINKKYWFLMTITVSV